MSQNNSPVEGVVLKRPTATINPPRTHTKNNLVSSCLVFSLSLPYMSSLCIISTSIHLNIILILFYSSSLTICCPLLQSSSHLPFPPSPSLSHFVIITPSSMGWCSSSLPALAFTPPIPLFLPRLRLGSG